MKEKALANDWPLDIEWALIGSVPTLLTKIYRAASIVEDAVAKRSKTKKAILGINPGSEQVRYTTEKRWINC